jgi:hypothetical protein
LLHELEDEQSTQHAHQNVVTSEGIKPEGAKPEVVSLCIKDSYTILDVSLRENDWISSLEESSEEYQKIKKHFEATIPHRIIRIEKTHNLSLERQFEQRSKKLSAHKICYLFHGSNGKAYDQILKTGFDLNYASPSGLLGAGIYFAEDASYSNTFGRTIRTTQGLVNHLLYCKVDLGKTCLGKTGMTQTPKGFDAVHSDSRTYAVFHNFQGIPEYIIYYLI